MDILSSLSGTPSKAVEVDKKEEMIHSAIEDWDSLIDLGSLQSALDEQADTLTQHYEQRVALRNSQQSSSSTSISNESGKEKDDQNTTGQAAASTTGTAVSATTVISNQQAMISLLTDHLKFAEHCFLALYKILRRLSHDPSKALKIALLRIQELHQKVMTLQSTQATQTKGKSTSKSAAAAASKLEDADRFKQSLRLDMKSELENKEALYREEALEMRERYQSEISSLISQLELANERIEQLESQIRLSQTISSSDVKAEKTEGVGGSFTGDDLSQMRKETENKLKESLEEIIEQKSNEVILLRGRLDEITKSYQEQIKTLRASLDEKISESSKLKDAVIKTQGYQEKVKELEQKIKKIISAQTEAAEENDLHADDDDVVRLIKVNNQLKKKIQEMKLQLEKAAQSEDNSISNSISATDNFASDDGGLSMIDALKNHRNRLKRDVEKRDAQIEKLMQQEISLRNQILTLEESQKQYQQRIRFLQNYKVSERSTLITPNDIEKAEGAGDNSNGSSIGNNGRGSGQSNLPLLGRGVEHKFQPLFDDKYSVKSITASQWFRPAMAYLVLIHIYVIYILMIKDDSRSC